MKRSPLKRSAPLRRTGFGIRGQFKPLRRTPLKAKPAPHAREGFTLAAKGEDTCRVCHGLADDPHHAVPRSLSRLGRSDLRNLLPLCRKCHNAWHAGAPICRSLFTPDEWAFIEEIAPSLGWLGRRYPLLRREAA